MSPRRWAEGIVLALLCAAAIALIGLEHHRIGWSLYFIGLIILPACRPAFTRDILLIYVSLGLLGLTPITTDLSWGHIFLMGGAIILAIVIPYVTSRFIYNNHLVRFPFHHGRRWFKSEIYWILGTGIVAYFLVPFYLRSSHAYLNWSIMSDGTNIGRLFLSTNGLGIWDELFFISTVLGILRRHLPFHLANVVQAIMFTSFLYGLSFTGWGPFMIFPFALLQGFVFRKTESLAYIITIHLTYDLILFFALLNTHNPAWLNIFVT